MELQPAGLLHTTGGHISLPPSPALVAVPHDITASEHRPWARPRVSANHCRRQRSIRRSGPRERRGRLRRVVDSAAILPLARLCLRRRRGVALWRRRGEGAARHAAADVAPAPTRGGGGEGGW